MTAATHRLKFRLLTIAVNEALFHVVRKGMADAAAAMDVDAELDGTPGVEAEELIGLARRALADGIDGIGLNVTEAGRFDAVISEAQAKSVPVVAFNIDAGRTAGGNLSYVAQDLRAAGAKLGERAKGRIARGSRVILTVHDEGVWALEERMAGIRYVLRDHDLDWQVISAGQDPTGGAERILTALQTFPATALLATGNGDTEACGLAARRLGRSAPYVAGFDLSPGIVDLIEAGFIDFSIDQQPYVQGFYPIVQLALYLRYGLLPASFDAGAAFIDKTNVKSVRELSHRLIR